MERFQQEELLRCIHCGLCLQACPTYVETGKEADSPRGRIYLMRAAAEGRIDWRHSASEHIDRCLGCRACEPACPSGVQYGSLVEVARAQVECLHVRSAVERFVKKLLLEATTRPALFALSLNFARLFAPLTKGKALPPLLGRMLEAHQQVVDLPKQKGWYRVGRLPHHLPALGGKRGTVGLLSGCVASVLYHQVNVATAGVLQRNGFDVVVPAQEECCGALHIHNGLPQQARKRALRLMRCFEQVEVDAIIVNSAGCGSTMKEYGDLFAGTSYGERARAFASKVKDVTEFLIEQGFRVPTCPLTGRNGRTNLVVTYHDACHLAHAQGIRKQPREIIRSIPGVELVELVESDMCCGSAGIYNLLQPEMAARLLDRKIKRILSTKAEIVLTGNPGCLAWIGQGLCHFLEPIPVMHPVELLYHAYQRMEAQ